MMHTTIVRAYLVEGSVPLSRTRVELYRNQAEPAELIGSASTDARGEATLRYLAVTPFTAVAVVRNQRGTAVRTIRVKPSANRPSLRIDLPIELSLARRLGEVGIKKGRSTERKKADLAAFLRKRTGRVPTLVPASNSVLREWRWTWWPASVTGRLPCRSVSRCMRNSNWARGQRIWLGSLSSPSTDGPCWTKSGRPVCSVAAEIPEQLTEWSRE